MLSNTPDSSGIKKKRKFLLRPKARSPLRMIPKIKSPSESSGTPSVEERLQKGREMIENEERKVNLKRKKVRQFDLRPEIRRRAIKLSKEDNAPGFFNEFQSSLGSFKRLTQHRKVCLLT